MILTPSKSLYVVQCYEDAARCKEPKRPLCIPEKAQFHDATRGGRWRGFWYWLDEPRTEHERRDELISDLGLPWAKDVDARAMMMP